MPYRAPAAACAADALLALSDRPDMTITELSKVTGSTRSLLYRVLAELRERALIEESRRPDDVTTYRLGFSSIEVGVAYVRSLPYLDLVRNVLRQLAQQTSETASLGVLRGRNVHYLMREEGSRSVLSVSAVGRSLPAHATAMGKAMLATLPKEELDALYGQDSSLVTLTPRTIADGKTLIERLAQVRNEPYGVDAEETILGRCGVGVAIDASAIGSHEIMGISLTSTLERFNEEPESLTGPLLTAQAYIAEQVASRAVFGTEDDFGHDLLWTK